MESRRPVSGGSEGRSGRPTVSRVLRDGSLVELVHDPAVRRTALVHGGSAGWTVVPSIDAGTLGRLVPYSPTNNLIASGAVLLPAKPEPFGTPAELVLNIATFLHRYVDLRPAFERIAAHYALLSWVYDAFNEVPYLRLRGDFGTGKTRALLAIGSVCYKPFFASGASTVSPIFHTLDTFSGTLVLDEGDFRMSDEKAEVVKILNNGNMRGMPVLRTMQDRQKEFNPRAFNVFGPKIVATRGLYEDRALESRFISEAMGGRPLRDDVPLNLPDTFFEEARALRNQLLAYRLEYRFRVGIDPSVEDRALEARTNQVLVPLLSIVEDAELRDELRRAAATAEADRLAERSSTPEAHLLSVLRDMLAEPERSVLPIREIVPRFIAEWGAEYRRPITHRWIGTLLRRLTLAPFKSHGNYVLSVIEGERILHLCQRYGLADTDKAA